MFKSRITTSASKSDAVIIWIACSPFTATRTRMGSPARACRTISTSPGLSSMRRTKIGLAISASCFDLRPTPARHCRREVCTFMSGSIPLFVSRVSSYSGTDVEERLQDTLSAGHDPDLVSIERMVEETAYLQPRRRGGLRIVRDSPVLGECYCRRSHRDHPSASARRQRSANETVGRARHRLLTSTFHLTKKQQLTSVGQKQS